MSEKYIFSTSDENFEKDVLEADVPILVDFWAEWCQPCKMLSPILKEIAKEYINHIKVFKMNVEDNTKIPNKYGVRGVPSLFIFYKKEVIAKRVGALSKSQLSDFLDENLHYS
ncbi:thioredoxin [Coxiella endosymbiont of Amblyomma americanum]|uniref:thioredoxin n=1 Tax=Coxiella endosymbiont of Amblyomma americanum TaxID=325775 RepID=UPI00057EC7FD|nr:thioredoxin [Coxiella endosymbiont of Amblyomma americanum]AJC50674.1 thioredoxin [Coxiella endosymbiont of Amblyomma americanum]AUJ58998.1 thiol reductase thioredoxin [Coxiella-like endosymbiont of Amblyomma americanum]